MTIKIKVKVLIPILIIIVLICILWFGISHRIASSLCGDDIGNVVESKIIDGIKVVTAEFDGYTDPLCNRTGDVVCYAGGGITGEGDCSRLQILQAAIGFGL